MEKNPAIVVGCLPISRETVMLGAAVVAVVAAAAVTFLVGKGFCLLVVV